MTALALLQMMELSTAHLSVATRAWLDAGAYPHRAPWGPSLLVREEGWLIGTSQAEPDSRAWYEEEFPRALPPDLELCLRVGAANGCAWVLFDMDEDPCPALPSYDDGNSIDRTPLGGGKGRAVDAWLPGIPRTGFVRWRGNPACGWATPHAGMQAVDLRKLRADLLRVDAPLAQAAGGR